MTKPYKILPLAEAFVDYPGGAKAFLLEHGDFVSKPKNAFAVVVDEDFVSDIGGGGDLDEIFGEEIPFDYSSNNNICAILFKQNCTIPNFCYIDREIDWSPSLIVMGNLSARALNLAGGNTLINGNCTVNEAIYGHYNHGELVVNGTINTPLIIADDYSMQLNGLVNTQYIIGAAWKTLAPKANVPVWDDSAQKKEIKAIIDPFFMNGYGLDSELINIALKIGDCVLKDKPANAKKRKKSDYYQLSDNVKGILNKLEAHTEPVTTVNLGGYHMGEFPVNFRQFKTCETLNLQNNSIKALPTWLVEFEALRHLNLGTNDVKALKLSPQQFSNLESLNISDTLITKIADEAVDLPQLTELIFGKKDYGGDAEAMTRMAIDFDWRRTPNLQHLHINETGWFWPWDNNFGFYQCVQLKYLHFGYIANGKMGKQLSQLQNLEFYGYETGWESDESGYAGEIDIDTLASLPKLAVLYVTKGGCGFDKNAIQAIRQRLPNLIIIAPYLDAGFEQDAAFKQINEAFDKTSNYQLYEPKNDERVQEMLMLVQKHRLNISPQWFFKTWENILKHIDGKARNCTDASLKKTYIKQVYDATQIVKPFVPKTASWTHLNCYSYDLWELVHAAEIWYALRREDHAPEHLTWALAQLAICLPIEQKRGIRQEFAELNELALKMQTK